MEKASNSETNLFIVHSGAETHEHTVWLVDSGCSHHMSGVKELFKTLDEAETQKVRLGDDKELQVAGCETVALKTADGQTKLIHNVRYIPSLAHYLLSIGQLMTAAYSVVFQGDMCQIKDVKTGEKLVNIHRTKNNMYPLEMSRVGCAYVAQSDMQKSMLWHERYGHLNFQSMQLLRQKSIYGAWLTIHEEDFFM